jgi:hypothetical protein
MLILCLFCCDPNTRPSDCGSQVCFPKKWMRGQVSSSHARNLDKKSSGQKGTECQTYKHLLKTNTHVNSEQQRERAVLHRCMMPRHQNLGVIPTKTPSRGNPSEMPKFKTILCHIHPHILKVLENDAKQPNPAGHQMGPLNLLCLTETLSLSWWTRI